MSKGGDAPKAPNTAATIAAQTASNQQTAQYQQQLNMVDQSNPLGSLKYTQISDGSDGQAPRYEADTTLTPQGQASFDEQQQVAEALNGLALRGTNQVNTALSQPAGYGNLPAAPTGLDLSGLPKAQSELDLSGVSQAPVTFDANAGKAASDALYAQATSRLDPQYAQQDKAMEAKLINSGLSKGTTAYDNAWESYNRSKNDAYTSANNSAVAGGASYAQALETGELAARNQGVNEAQQGFADSAAARTQGVNEQQTSLADALQLRQQGVTEQNYLRELPLNEVTALESGGQVGMPNFGAPPQSSVSGTNVAGITQTGYQNQVSAYQQQQAQQQALLGDVFGLAGAAFGV